jgi:hypothetical protein
MPDKVPMTVTDRAYTSPIWYTLWAKRSFAMLGTGDWILDTWLWGLALEEDKRKA